MEIRDSFNNSQSGFSFYFYSRFSFFVQFFCLYFQAASNCNVLCNVLLCLDSSKIKLGLHWVTVAISYSIRQPEGPSWDVLGRSTVTKTRTGTSRYMASFCGIPAPSSRLFCSFLSQCHPVQDTLLINSFYGRLSCFERKTLIFIRVYLLLAIIRSWHTSRESQLNCPCPPAGSGGGNGGRYARTWMATDEYD